MQRYQLYPREMFLAYDHTGGIEISTSLTPITWDTQHICTPAFSHSSGSETITIERGYSRYYRIYVEITSFEKSGTSASRAEYHIYLNGSEIEGATFCVNSNDPSKKQTASCVWVEYLGKDDTITVKGQTNSGKHKTAADGSRIFIEEL